MHCKNNESSVKLLSDFAQNHHMKGRNRECIYGKFFMAVDSPD